MNMLKMLTDLALGTFAVANLSVGAVAQTPPAAWEDWIQKLGALGLCAFMVLQNYRQTEALAKVVAGKDSQILEMVKQNSVDRQESSAALKELSAVLRERPCIMGGQRIAHPRTEGD